MVLGMTRVVIAQNYNVWQYLGTRLDFTTEPPTYTPNLDGISGFQASICDNSGKLLFYTGGYNELPYLSYNLKNANGDVLMPTDSAFATGSGNRYRNLFIGIDDTLFYHIFFADIQNQGKAPGMYYTLLNKNLNNGSGGIVPGQLNVRISPLPFVGITANQASDGSWWMISYTKDSLYAFHATSKGIDPIPTITSVLENQYPKKYIEFQFPIAGDIMRFSHDGKKMIRCLRFNPSFSINSDFYQTTVLLYNFDQTTGKFSSPIVAYSDTLTTSGSYSQLITDMEFAPDNSKVYFLYYRGNPSNIIPDSIEPIISQFDLNAPDFQSSEKIICSVIGRAHV